MEVINKIKIDLLKPGAVAESVIISAGEYVPRENNNEEEVG